MPDSALKNPREVLAHLKDQGYKIAQSTVYEHKKLNWLRPNPDGEYTEKEIFAYIKRAGLVKKGEAKLSTLQARDAAAKVLLREKQAALMETKERVLSGAYISRDQHERDLAERLRVLKNGLLNWGRSHIDELIDLVGGEPATAPEALAMFEDSLLDLLDGYARRGEFTVEPPEAAQ